MKVLPWLLAIFFFGMITAVSAAQDDLDALRRRLAELEVEQSKSNETIESLRQEIDALRVKTEDPWLTERRTEEMRGLMTEILSDAEYQTNLLKSKGGPMLRPVFPELANESQFVLKSKDGDFSLAIDGLIVFRYEFNDRSDDGTGTSGSDQGFELTGLRMNMRGHLYKDFGYWVRFSADDPEGGHDIFIDAAMGMYYFDKDTILVFGQFPSLLTRDQGSPVDKLLTTESSPTNYEFDPFGFQGVMLALHSPRLVFRGIISDGYRSSNNAFFDSASADWALGGQLSWMAVGGEDDWTRFNNFTSRPGNDFVWLLNAAFHVQEGATNLSPNGEQSDLFLLIGESSMEGDGWNIYGSVYYRHTDPSSDGIEADDFGFVIQGGTWVSKNVEVYSRFDMTMSDGDRPTENADFRTATIGFSYYPRPSTDTIKFSTELLYMFDAESTSIVDPNIFSGVRASPAGDQFALRAQMHIRW